MTHTECLNALWSRLIWAPKFTALSSVHHVSSQMRSRIQSVSVKQCSLIWMVEFKCKSCAGLKSIMVQHGFNGILESKFKYFLCRFNIWDWYPYQRYCLVMKTIAMKIQVYASDYNHTNHVSRSPVNDIYGNHTFGNYDRGQGWIRFIILIIISSPRRWGEGIGWGRCRENNQYHHH